MIRISMIGAKNDITTLVAISPLESVLGLTAGTNSLLITCAHCLAYGACLLNARDCPISKQTDDNETEKMSE